MGTRRKLTVLFALAALFGLSFATLPERFDRPWMYENMWGSPDFVDYTLSYPPPLSPGWNPKTLHASFDYLGLGGMDECAYGSGLNASLDGKRRADTARDEVLEFEANGLNGYFPPWYMDFVQALGFDQCAYFENINSEFCRSIRFFVATKYYSANYSSGWKSAMNSALDTMERQAAAVNSNETLLAGKLASARKSGACTTMFDTGGACSDANILVHDAQVGLGEYGDVYSAYMNASAGVEALPPKVRAANAVDGTCRLLDALTNSTARLENLKIEAANRTDAVRKRADAAITNAKTLKDKCASNNINKVVAGGGLGGTGSIGVPATLYADGVRALDAAMGNRSEAENTWVAKEDGYLYTAAADAMESQAYANAAAQKFGDALSSAETAQGDMRADAVAAIGEAEKAIAASHYKNPQADRLLNSSKEALNEGDNAGRLGDRFSKYSNAYDYALEAARAVSAADSAAGTDGNASAYVSECTLAKNAVIAAKKDNIGTFVEEAMLNASDNVKNPEDAARICSDAYDSILASEAGLCTEAANRRKEALAAIAMCGTRCSDIMEITSEAEFGMVDAYGLDCSKAIGRMASLIKGYRFALNESEKTMGQYSKEYMRAYSEFSSAPPELGKSAPAHLDVIVQNPTEYRASDVTIYADSPVGFGIQDAISESGRLKRAAYSGGRVMLNIVEINGSESLNISFERQFVPLQVTAYSESAAGFPDGSAQYSKKYSVAAQYAVGGFYLPEEPERVFVDGLGAATLGRYVNARLEKGGHSVEMRGSEDEGWTREVVYNSSTPAGARTYLKYRLEITGMQDMDYIDFDEYSPAWNGSAMRAICLSGEKITSSQEGRLLKMRLSGLRANKSALVEISMELDNTEAFVKSELENISKANLSDAADEFVGMARMAATDGNYALAAEYVLQARVQMKKDSSDLAKAGAKNTASEAKIIAEIAEINGSFARHPAANALTGAYAARRDALSALLAGAQQLDENAKSAKYSAYDSGWADAVAKSYRKNASAELETLDAAYARFSDTALWLEIGAAKDALEMQSAWPSISNTYELAALVADADSSRDALVAANAETDMAKSAGCSAVIKTMDAALKDYAQEASDAKGTVLESSLAWDSADGKLVSKRATAALNGGWGRDAETECAGLADSLGAANATLSALSSRATGGLNAAHDALGSANGTLDEKDFVSMQKAVASADEMRAAGRDAKSLLYSLDAMAIANSRKTGQNYWWLAGLGILLAGGAAAYYYYPAMRGGNGAGGEKILKKLEKGVEL
jgi:hypothetical protein